MLKDNIHKRSRLQERRAANDYGGHITPGSGNQWHSKGDVHSDKFIVECKSTTHASYSLKAADFLKLYLQSVVENKQPVMEIEFAHHNLTLVVQDKRDLFPVGT